MEPVLNKLEIANLLKAIREGKVTLDPTDAVRERFLTCSPINLFKMTRPGHRHFRIPNFDIILDSFCQFHNRSLTNQLQRASSITQTALETFEFEKFMARKSGPGAIGVLDMSPLKHGALIMFDSALSFSMIEMMLGACGDLDSPRMERRLTPIELNIMETVIHDTCRDLNKAFSPLIQMNSTLVRLENNSRLISIIEPDDEVIVGTFAVKAGEYFGEIDLVFPFATLDPLRQPLEDLLNVPTAAKSTWQETLETEALNLATVITAQSGNLALTIKKVLQMKKGDILPIDYDPNAPVKILVEGRPKFTAISGTHNNIKAISLTGATQ